MHRLLLRAAVSQAVTLMTVISFPSFRARIPNGDLVPDPCINGSLWQAVGHYDPIGWGELNSFGFDFIDEGFMWTQALCLRDSDYDGRSNGYELGDPNCTWTPEKSHTGPLKATGNPGICEPLKSHRCVEEKYVCSSQQLNK